ncbi:MAG: hypothetical protein ACR2G5_10540 [Pyrinomonadaceae bacterium]
MPNKTSAQSRHVQSSEPGKLAGMVVDLNDARINGAKVLITGKDFKRELVVDDEASSRSICRKRGM